MMKSTKMPGRKDDHGKTRWDLLDWDFVRYMAEVMTVGAGKYGDNNWKQVPDAYNRYFAAAMRHITDDLQGIENDAEDGLPHLAHAACCLMFMLATGKEGEQPSLLYEYGINQPKPPMAGTKHEQPAMRSVTLAEGEGHD